MLRRVSVAIATAAVVLAGVNFASGSAIAAVSGASISPSSWSVGTTTSATINWTESASRSSVMVRSPWPWPNSYTGTVGSPTTSTASVSGGSGSPWVIACPFGVFTLPAASTVSGTIECKSAKSPSSPNFFTAFWLIAGGGGTLTYTGAVQVDVVSGAVTAPGTARTDTWIVGQYSTANTASDISAAGNVEVATSAVSTDGTTPSPPPITLDFDGNGGTCTPSSVTGNQGTWGTALTADQCTNGSRRLAFFSTSPTAGAGATNVRPGGPIYFLEANRLYAIWEFEKPSPVTDVVATSGLNSLKVTWKPPVSNGGDPINSYCIALRTETNANPFPRCVNSALPLEFTATLPATNSKYSFTVFARNAAGSSEPVASGPVSPYDIKGVTASRKDVLLGLGGTQVEARGDAPGLAGQTLTVEYKVGTGQWTTQANAVKVDAASKFRWSNKFPRSSNKNAVSVRFTYGSDAVVGPFVLNRGGEAGDLSAPRNIRVDNQVNKVNVTWERPKFDGGATITGYTLCAVPGSGGGRTCRSVSGTEGTFWNLNTRQTYTFTVSAKTAGREGPRGTYAKPVDPTEASIGGAARSFDQLTADVRGEGFKKNSRFRVEMAIPVPGENPRTWNWDEVTSFKEGQESFKNNLQIPLDASVRGERLILRLITPTGTVSSRISRP